MDAQKQPTDSPLSARIEDLQVKIAFLDDLVEALNQTVASQQRHLLDLQQQMQLLYQRLESDQNGDRGVEPFDTLHDMPPHY